MKVLTVEHTTTYRYAQPVRLGPHRMMIRPRDSHDIRLIDTGLRIDPAPVRLTWMYDVFANSIGIARFAGETTALTVSSRIVLERYPPAADNFPLAETARSYPFRYDESDLPDLLHLVRRHYADPDRTVERWARGFLAGAEATPTRDLLLGMTRGIQTGLTYRARPEEGTQAPAETLALGSGTCRDYALLMMEGLRALGLASRFVTGYLHDPAVDPPASAAVSGAGSGSVTGAGATHAWIEVYLPGAGWLEFDPTNGCEGGTNLVRVAATRDPKQAMPISGTFSGPSGVAAELDVKVRVTAT